MKRYPRQVSHISSYALRFFISTLFHYYSAFQEISRRELRRSLELQGGASKLREEEILVLCDSLDLDRRGRVHLSDVRDALTRGAVVARGDSGEAVIVSNTII